MQTATASAYSFTPFSAGVDWLTASAKAGSVGRPFRQLQNKLLDDERAARGDVQRATLRDYTGFRGEGWFVGSRQADSLTILSGPRCAALFSDFATAASNVSRLDLQVTVWTHGEQPTLAREAYHHLKSLPPSRGRPRNLTLIQSHPKGETLNVNRRTSDAYGRLYDWSAAHAQGEARTVWRYEVEYKRHLAMAQARAALSAPCLRTHAGNTVHSWFKVRGLPQTWANEGFLHSEEPISLRGSKGQLDWMERSLRITIARAINSHGLARVLAALGLDDKVVPRKEARKAYGSDADRPLQGHRNR